MAISNVSEHSSSTATTRLNGRNWAGREAKRWRKWALSQKSGVSRCPLHIRFEIDLAMFDLWLMLELADIIALDVNKRGTALNKRFRTLPKIHDQYQGIALRFAKRVEALALDKGPGLDLARQLQQQAQQANGAK
jgi:hypothetical protein